MKCLKAGLLASLVFSPLALAATGCSGDPADTTSVNSAPVNPVPAPGTQESPAAAGTSSGVNAGALNQGKVD